MADPFKQMSSARKSSKGTSDSGTDKREVGAFLIMLFVAIIALATLYFMGLLSNLLLLAGITIILGLVYVQSPDFVIQLNEYQRAILFRRGKFLRVADPGWVVLVPFVDEAVVKDLRVKTVDITPQEVVTKDNIKLNLDAVIFLKIEDPKAAVLNVESPQKAAADYVKAHLRDVVGEMSLADAISNIAQVNKKLEKGLKKVGSEWGVKVEKVEIQELVLPPSVMKAMHEKREAEEHKEAKKREAEAKEYHISRVKNAAENLSDPALQYLYLQALEEVGRGKSSKIIFPIELTHLAERLGRKSNTEGIEEQLKEKYKDMILDQMRKGEENPEEKALKKVEKEEEEKEE